MKKLTLLVAVLGVAGVLWYYFVIRNGSGKTAEAIAPIDATAVSGPAGAQGPGLRRAASDGPGAAGSAMFDLAHVTPERFAAAFANNPERLFTFVRDEISFEAYQGQLRGARGTLLARAGNAVDRATLLAALFVAAGQQIRFVRGALAEDAARNLVTSIWAGSGSGRPASREDPPAPLVEAQKRFETSVRRDFALVWKQLQAANPAPASAAVPVDVLIRETRDHYWVQWLNNGAWTDLDPSFASAAMGQAFASQQETLATLPDALAHRIALTIRLEEYTGETPAKREILRFSAPASDLSGMDVVLTHVPENWRGPTSSVAGALTEGIESNGRIKPVLAVGNRIVTGESFAQQVKQAGLGGIGALLRGTGSRESVPLATAEWLEVELTGPGHRETVVRELYDLVGIDQRQQNARLTPAEVASRTDGAKRFDATLAFYSLLFTTGAIDPIHLRGTAVAEAPQIEGTADLRALLRRLTVAYVTTSDGILARLGQANRSLIRFYADSPRLVIAEVSETAGTARLQLDLRRDDARCVMVGSRPEDALAATILRGVINGTLERNIVEYATGGARADAVLGHMSTSLVFQHAQSEGVPLLLLPRDRGKVDASVSMQALARLDEEATQGFLAVAPQRPINLAGVPRFAWWRFNPKNGRTLSITDEGLHQGATEYRIVDHGNGQVTVVVRSRNPLIGIGQSERTFNTAGGALQWVERLLENGATLVEGPFWLPPI